MYSHSLLSRYGPLGVSGNTKMFPDPRKYMRWHDMHFPPRCCRLKHRLWAYVLFCASTLPLFGALCASKNRTHKIMRPGYDGIKFRLFFTLRMPSDVELWEPWYESMYIRGNFWK
jgi:hypothetical protein